MSTPPIHCNFCGAFPGAEKHYYFSSCGHICCGTCKAKARLSPTCLYCKKKVKIEEIGPSMQNKELFSDISKMLAALSSSIKQDSVLSEKSQSQDEEFDPQDGILRDDASDDEDDIKQRRLKSANYFTRSLKCVKSLVGLSKTYAVLYKQAMSKAQKSMI